MNNIVKHYIYTGVWAIVILFTAGGMIQNFFVNIGFSPNHIGIYTSMINIIQIAIMVFGIFSSDNVKNVKRTMAFLAFGPVLTCVAMLPACFIFDINIEIMFFTAIVCCCVQNLFVGFKNVLAYRLPYLIIDMKDYTKLTNVGTVISGVISIGAGVLITYLSTAFPFRYVMAVGFLLSIVCCITASVLIGSMKTKNIEVSKEKNDFSVKKLARKDFAYFYIPNFARGMANGLVSVIAVICSAEITSDPTVISALITILSIASIVGCTSYQKVSRKIKTRTAYLISSIIMCVFLPLMVIGRSVSAFCIFFFLAGIGYHVVAVTGAVYAAEIMTYDDMGTYTSVRLIVMTAGQATASFLVGALTGKIPVFVIMLAGGLCQLISGIMFYLYKKNKN